MAARRGGGGGRRVKGGIDPGTGLPRIRSRAGRAAAVGGMWDYVHERQADLRRTGIPFLPSKHEQYVYEVRRYSTYSQTNRNKYIVGPMDYNAVRTDPYFKFWRRELAKHEGRVARGLPVDRSPNGLYAEALERLHYRRPQSPWNVGETPKVKSR